MPSLWGIIGVLLVAQVGLLPTAQAQLSKWLNSSSQVPIVVWHGMGDSCFNDFSMGSFATELEDHLDDVYVKLLCFGDNVLTDSMSGFFQDANHQVETACKAIAEDEELQNGYNAIGLSQGGQFLRAVAQRCPWPPMKNLVSLGGQHQGIYGVPHCTSANPLCALLSKFLSPFADSWLLQHLLTQAQYWHDARRPDRYRRKNTFLADINNDVEEPSRRNATYAVNLAKLEHLILVRFDRDSMVVPVNSSWFEFYAPGSTSQMLPLEQSPIYTEDWIGLRKLAESGRLVRLSVDGDHLQFSFSWFLENVVDKYLRTPK